MWRHASVHDDDAVHAMCLALNREDPGPEPVPEEHIERTLRVLREEPQRGRALVLEVDGRVLGYALVISFWSNERGGEVLVIDELFVTPECRGRGYGSRLIEGLSDGLATWAPRAVALSLEVTPTNARARRLYERLGFVPRNLILDRRLGRGVWFANPAWSKLEPEGSPHLTRAKAAAGLACVQRES